MISCLIRNGFRVLAVSAFLAAGSVAAAEHQDQDPRRDQSAGRPAPGRVGRFAQRLDERTEKIAQLKKQIKQDRQRVEAFRQELRQLHATMAERRQLILTADPVNQVDRPAPGDRRAKAALLKENLQAAAEARDAAPMDVARRRLQRLDAADGDRQRVLPLDPEQRQEMIRRFEEKIRSAEATQQHEHAQELKHQLRQLMEAGPDRPADQWGGEPKHGGQDRQSRPRLFDDEQTQRPNRTERRRRAARRGDQAL